MEEKGYTVEYIAPQDNRAILQDLFDKVLDRLASGLPGGASLGPAGKVTERKDSYSCKTYLEDERGYISFSYDDYIPDFDSFEEYMHSGSADRGRLYIDILLDVPAGEDSIYKEAFRRIDEKERAELSYRGGKGHGEISASRSIGIYLLSPDENDVDFIYDSVMDLWKRIRHLTDEAARLKSN